jgi:hypothetical protein
MFPKVYRTIRTPAVAAIVDTRIGRHGEVSQTEQRPYITWQIVAGQPYDNLSSAPCGDFTTVQLDCYHPTDAGAEQLALAVRAALDAALICNRVVIDNRDPDTKLYRVGMEADFIDQR